MRQLSSVLALLAAVVLYFPQWSAAEEPLRIVVISDINGRYGRTDYHRRVAVAIQRVIALQPALVISTGDMVAGQRPSPKLRRAELEAMWDSFDEVVRQPLAAAAIPLLMTPGNHDASAYPGYEAERAAYRAYHAAHPPALKPLDGGRFPYHYAVDFQGLLLVSLDATATGPLPATQLRWLETQLDSRPPGTPVIVFGHLPMQPVAIGRERDVIQDPALEKLLQKAGNASYLSGHNHAFYPGHRLDINMFSIGNLGGNLRSLVGGHANSGFSFALLELGTQGGVRISAFTGPTFEQAVDTAILPAQLGSGQQRLQRYDLARPDLLLD